MGDNNRGKYRGGDRMTPAAMACPDGRLLRVKTSTSWAGKHRWWQAVKAEPCSRTCKIGNLQSREQPLEIYCRMLLMMPFLFHVAVTSSLCCCAYSCMWCLVCCTSTLLYTRQEQHDIYHDVLNRQHQPKAIITLYEVRLNRTKHRVLHWFCRSYDTRHEFCGWRLKRTFRGRRITLENVVKQARLGVSDTSHDEIKTSAWRMANYWRKPFFHIISS